MQLFFWRKNKQIDTFASTLANDLYSAVQPDTALTYISGINEKSNKGDKKIDRRLQDLVFRIQEFRVQHSLGVYGKARLHLTFTERLKELGYEPKVAEKLNELILLRTP